MQHSKTQAKNLILLMKFDFKESLLMAYVGLFIRKNHSVLVTERLASSKDLFGMILVTGGTGLLGSKLHELKME